MNRLISLKTDFNEYMYYYNVNILCCCIYSSIPVYSTAMQFHFMYMYNVQFTSVRTIGYILRSRPQSRAKFKIAPCPYVNVNNRVYIVAILDENARGRSSNSGWITLKWNESEKFIFHVKIIDVKINGEEKNFKLSNFSFIILLFFACHRIILF